MTCDLQVSYEQIKTLLAIEDLNVSTEAMGWRSNSHDAPIQIDSLGCAKGDRTDEASWRSLIKNRAVSQSESNGRQSNAPLVPPICEPVAGGKQPRSDDSLLNECSSKKLHKSNDQEGKCCDRLEATESGLLEWVTAHDGVGQFQFLTNIKHLYSTFFYGLANNFCRFRYPRSLTTSGYQRKSLLLSSWAASRGTI